MMRSLRLATAFAVLSLCACGTAPNAAHCQQTSDCTGDAVCAQNLCQQGYRLSMAPDGDGAGRITSSPDAFNCSEACSAPLAAGTNLTLHAIPDANSDFFGWSGGCSGTGDCPVTMDAAKSVTALFRSNALVFTSSRALDGSDTANTNTAFNIWRMNADGSGLLPLTRGTAANSITPRPSPDGRQIAFTSSLALDGTDAAIPVVNVWRVNRDGAGLTPLTRATASGDGTLSISPPLWSPDGKQLAFSSARNVDGSDTANLNGVTNVWRVNADGTGLTALTKATASGASSFRPQWSPDGTKLVFSSDLKLDSTDASNTATNIWVVNANGTALTPLTTATASGASSSEPVWSPDGTRIVFTTSRNLDGNPASAPNPSVNIWAVNADGTHLVSITRATAAGTDSTSPQWTPDGKRIIFTSTRNVDLTNTPNANNTANLWRIDADGGNLAPITHSTLSGDTTLGLMFPRISLEGSRIFFSSSLALDGSNTSNPPNATLNIWRFSLATGTLTPLTRASASGANSLSCATADGSLLPFLQVVVAAAFLKRRRRPSV